MPSRMPLMTLKREGEEKHAPIDGDADIERNGRGQAERGESRGGPEREHEAECAAAEAEQQAFKQDLAAQAGAGGASARRTAMSRWRPTACAKSRLATLAPAMASTSNTTVDSAARR